MLNASLADPFSKATDAGSASSARQASVPAGASTTSRRPGSAQNDHGRSFANLLQSESAPDAPPADPLDRIALAWAALNSSTASLQAEGLASRNAVSQDSETGLDSEDNLRGESDGPEADSAAESACLSLLVAVHLPVPEEAPARSFSFAAPQALESANETAGIESESGFDFEEASEPGVSTVIRPAATGLDATGSTEAQSAGAAWTSTIAQPAPQREASTSFADGSAETLPETRLRPQPQLHLIERHAGVEQGAVPQQVQPLVAEGELQQVSTTVIPPLQQSGGGAARAEAITAAASPAGQVPPAAGHSSLSGAQSASISGKFASGRHESDASGAEEPGVEPHEGSSRVTQAELGRPEAVRRAPAPSDASSGSDRDGQRPGERPFQETSIAGVNPRPALDSAFTTPEASASATPSRVREVVQAAAADEVPLSSAPKDISIRVASADGQHVDLRFAESRGSVTLTMRTSDADLAGALRNDLPSLEKKLDTHGWQATLRPASDTAASGRDTTRNADSAAAADRSAAARTAATPPVKTSEAGMQFGQGSESGRSGRAWTEEEQELRDLAALRRLAVQGGINR